MSKNIIRIRFLSLSDAVQESVTNVILYLKKLTKDSTSDESRIELEEKNRNSAVVLSWNEPYDLSLEDEFFQVLFLESTDEPKVITDIVFYQHYLLDLLTYSVQNDDQEQEVFCYASLDEKCILKYSLQFVPNITDKGKKIHRKVEERQPIRGHLMIKRQFNEPVFCAVCKKFIIGLRLQGYRCERCSLVTDSKCCHRIPFYCQKYPKPDARYQNGNTVLLEYHHEHIFHRYEPSLFPSITPCRNCGSQVSGNGRKCTLCRFVVHERCEMSVPSMCGISYKVRANAIQRNSVPGVNIHPISSAFDTQLSQSSNTTSLSSIASTITSKDSPSHHSNSSSVDVRWLDPLPAVELSDLPKFSDFECIGHLGSGQYSNVYYARHLPSRKFVAIKMIDGSNESARSQFEIERQLLFRYSHQNPFIIKAYCSFHQGSNLFLVMEFVGGASLKEKIQRTRMNENDIRYYLAEIISVVQYLHSNKIIYRDLKLEHILVCSEGHIHLVDFGLGRILNHDDEVCHTICGTDTYMSPEIRRLEENASADGYSYPVDFWAIGIMFLQLLCGEQIDFYDEATNLSNLAESLLCGRPISVEARSLMRGLLEVDPKKRLGSPNSPYGSIRDHGFFKVVNEIDWDEVDDGVLKSIHRRSSRTRANSDPSIELSVPILSLDRGPHFLREWTTVGQSQCQSDEDEQFYKSFDYLNRSLWSKFSQRND